MRERFSCKLYSSSNYLPRRAFVNYLNHVLSVSCATPRQIYIVFSQLFRSSASIKKAKVCNSFTRLYKGSLYSMLASWYNSRIQSTLGTKFSCHIPRVENYRENITLSMGRALKLNELLVKWRNYTKTCRNTQYFQTGTLIQRWKVKIP